MEITFIHNIFGSDTFFSYKIINFILASVHQTFFISYTWGLVAETILDKFNVNWIIWSHNKSYDGLVINFIALGTISISSLA